MSNKRDQVLRIEPKNEIHFKGPYNRVVTEYFHLSNPSEKPIAFKVKTTAPKRYCVRPNNGTIAPGKSVNVAVMLQPLTGNDQQTTALEKNKHKFMIQAVFVATDVGNADDLFKAVPVDEIMDSKFRCVFDDTLNAAPNAAGPISSGAANNRSESDNEIDKDGLVEAMPGRPGGLSAVANDHDDVSSTVFSTAASMGSLMTSSAAIHTTPDSSHLTNGANDDTTLISNARLVNASGDLGESKRLLDENRELRVKLQELERSAKSTGGAAYNRFAASNVSSSSSSHSQAKATPPVAATGGNLSLDQQFTPQVIVALLVALLMGFILGKVDLGLF